MAYTHLPPRANGLLADLCTAEYQRVERHLEAVDLPQGCRLSGDPARLERFYFLAGGLLSMTAATTGHENFEVALVGRAGGFGLPLVLCASAPGLDALVQVEARAYALPAAELRAEFAAGGGLQTALLDFSGALMTRIARHGSCQLHHTPAQRLCGWVVAALDRLGGELIPVSAERIGTTLGLAPGVGREAAAKLRAGGLIETREDGIRVLDRAGLEANACDCYRG